MGIREEVRWKNVRFSDEDWFCLMDHGVRARWKTSKGLLSGPRVWLLLRVLLASIINFIFFFGMVIAGFEQQLDCDKALKSPDGEISYPLKEKTTMFPYFFIFLTNWGIFFQVIYLNSSALATFLYFVPHYTSRSGRFGESPARQPFLVTLAWWFRTWSLPGCFCISLLYFALLHPFIDIHALSSAQHLYLYLAHVGNILVQLLDLPLSYEPFLFSGSYVAMQRGEHEMCCLNTAVEATSLNHRECCLWHFQVDGVSE